MKIWDLRDTIVSNRGEGYWNIIYGYEPIRMVMRANARIALELQKDTSEWFNDRDVHYLKNLPSPEADPYILHVKLDGEVVDSIRFIEIDGKRAYIPHPQLIRHSGDERARLRISVYEDALGAIVTETLDRLDKFHYDNYIRMIGAELTERIDGKPNYA